MGDTIDIPAEDGSTSETNKQGIVINPNTSVTSITVWPMSSCNADTVYVIDDSDGSELQSKSFSGETKLENFGTLSSGNYYRVLSNSGGNSYTQTWANTNFDLTSNTFDVTSGWNSGSYDNTYARNFDKIGANLVSAPSLSTNSPTNIRDT